jgi:hypothetical protein
MEIQRLNHSMWTGVNSQTADPTSTQDVGVIEFVATFPNTQVNVGDQYRACVLTLNTMDKYCEEGNNSPAKRPEFVDITMDKAIESDSVEKKSKVKRRIPCVEQLRVF